MHNIANNLLYQVGNQHSDFKISLQLLPDWIENEGNLLSQDLRKSLDSKIIL